MYLSELRDEGIDLVELGEGIRRWGWGKWGGRESLGRTAALVEVEGRKVKKGGIFAAKVVTPPPTHNRVYLRLPRKGKRVVRYYIRSVMA